MNKLIFLITILLAYCNSFEKTQSNNKLEIKNTVCQNITEAEEQNDQNDLAKALSIIQVKTGYYNSYRVRYCPRIIMKWKNISGKPIDQNIKVKGVFMLGDEIINDDSEYIQVKGDVPFESGFTKQFALTGCSSLGFEYSKGYSNYDVICLIYVNNKLFGKYSIKNELLDDERL